MVDMTLAMAERAVRAAHDKARQLGAPMTVTVVDEAGRLVLCARGDGTGFFSPETSRAKAVAAANFHFRIPTAEMADRAKTSAFWMSVPSVLAGHILPSHGGMPITVKGRVIGGIGCGGGTGEQDHECAVAGAAALAG
ncbi:MAG TPA: heme-binding protein [Candidatus Methylomirabilis sp.]|nr:heme-binding protein [Candidatus Methylomirabilis sp.]